jgi:hypothetical protein
MKTVTADRLEVARPHLLRTPSSRPDESLMGYILRLAAEQSLRFAEVDSRSGRTEAAVTR